MTKGLVCSVSVGLLGLGFVLAAPAADPSPAAIDFNRQVLPLLSEHCFACHGPD